MTLTTKQVEVKTKIEMIASLLGINPTWASAVAMTESSLGQKQKSPTGCRGVFQMSAIAMKDLLQEMEQVNDDMVDIVCGIAFLRLLLNRWKTEDAATEHFCDPKDRDFYIRRVHGYMQDFKRGE
jgi:hypothetical protein